MRRMQTRIESFAPALNWLDPFGSWDAAARWNTIASEWMTRGWQQWLQLVTVWPALERAPAAPCDVLPAQAGTQEARNARTVQELARESRVARKEAKAPTGEARATARKANERPAARRTSKRSAPPRPARPQAGARSSRTRG